MAARPEPTRSPLGARSDRPNAEASRGLPVLSRTSSHETTCYREHRFPRLRKSSRRVAALMDRPRFGRPGQRTRQPADPRDAEVCPLAGLRPISEATGSIGARGKRPHGGRDRLRRNPAAHSFSPDTCSAFVRSISVATPTSLLLCRLSGYADLRLGGACLACFDARWIASWSA